MLEIFFAPSLEAFGFAARVIIDYVLFAIELECLFGIARFWVFFTCYRVNSERLGIRNCVGEFCLRVMEVYLEYF